MRRSLVRWISIKSECCMRSLELRKKTRVSCKEIAKLGACPGGDVWSDVPSEHCQSVAENGPRWRRPVLRSTLYSGQGSSVLVVWQLTFFATRLALVSLSATEDFLMTCYELQLAQVNPENWVSEQMRRKDVLTAEYRIYDGWVLQVSPFSITFKRSAAPAWHARRLTICTLMNIGLEPPSHGLCPPSLQPLGAKPVHVVHDVLEHRVRLLASGGGPEFISTDVRACPREVLLLDDFLHGEGVLRNEICLRILMHQSYDYGDLGTRAWSAGWEDSAAAILLRHCPPSWMSVILTLTTSPRSIPSNLFDRLYEAHPREPTGISSTSLLETYACCPNGHKILSAILAFGRVRPLSALHKRDELPYLPKEFLLMYALYGISTVLPASLPAVRRRHTGLPPVQEVFRGRRSHLSSRHSQGGPGSDQLPRVKTPYKSSTDKQYPATRKLAHNTTSVKKHQGSRTLDSCVIEQIGNSYSDDDDEQTKAFTSLPPCQWEHLDHTTQQACTDLGGTMEMFRAETFTKCWRKSSFPTTPSTGVDKCRRSAVCVLPARGL
ncbi:hypothetical protein PR048_029567 [Dryococelus australis]|uniref:Uncharacterized protein n=1 Tax=Dryococelus australis TaxID=614101 RepID=A0ABQ9GDR0_9NEOP|nr:hypothetical protein PR048_029567 [Dryococelus australis]